MKVSGDHVIEASRERVWEALRDPAVLARTLPGCESLEVAGPGAFAVTIHAGVASLTGSYHGTVTLSDEQSPEHCRMSAAGSGTPGTISADAALTLAEVDGERTRVTYDADAVVGGMLGGVGQRVLVGVSQRTAGEFFANVERDLTGVAAPEPEAATAAEPGAGRQPEVGEVFAGTAGRGGARPDATRLLLAGLAGAAVALLGVLVGRSITR